MSEREPFFRQDHLLAVTLTDYETLQQSELTEWTQSREQLPDAFWEKIKGIPPDATLRDTLTRIKQAVFDTFADKRHQAQSFEESRFTSLPAVLEKGMTSCGALTNVFGTTLRRMGVPVKYVHGRYEDKEGTYSHSWLDIYEPSTGQWIEADPTTDGFALEQGAYRIKEYHDWHELKEEYEQGRFTPKG